ncbi:hypothetical protein GGF37_002634, partial [Kickxella alabastrina]
HAGNMDIANVAGFMARVKEMVLAIQRIDIWWCNATYKQPGQGIAGLLSDTTMVFVRGVDQISFREYDWIVTDCIQRNAAMLKSLSLYGLPTTDTIALLHDSQNNPVVHETLESVTFAGVYHIGTSDQVEAVAVVENAVEESRTDTTVHFPHLKSTKLSGEHPFYDNVLFGGNSDTIKTLVVSVYITSLIVARDYRIFENGPLTCLRSRIVNAVCRLKFHANVFCKELTQQIDTGNIISGLWVLRVPGMSLSLQNIVDILKRALHLCKLVCAIIDTTPTVANMAGDELVKHMVDLRGALSVYFKFLKILDTAYALEEPMLKGIALLAIACTALFFIDGSPDCAAQNKQALEGIAASELYKSHADRINEIKFE